jgi:hypothetical protein
MISVWTGSTRSHRSSSTCYGLRSFSGSCGCSASRLRSASLRFCQSKPRRAKSRSARNRRGHRAHVRGAEEHDSDRGRPTGRCGTPVRVRWSTGGAREGRPAAEGPRRDSPVASELSRARHPSRITSRIARRGVSQERILAELRVFQAAVANPSRRSAEAAWNEFHVGALGRWRQELPGKNEYDLLGQLTAVGLPDVASTLYQALDDLFDESEPWQRSDAEQVISSIIYLSNLLDDFELSRSEKADVSVRLDCARRRCRFRTRRHLRVAHRPRRRTRAA